MDQVGAWQVDMAAVQVKLPDILGDGIKPLMAPLMSSFHRTSWRKAAEM